MKLTENKLLNPTFISVDIDQFLIVTKLSGNYYQYSLKCMSLFSNKIIKITGFPKEMLYLLNQLEYAYFISDRHLLKMIKINKKLNKNIKNHEIFNGSYLETFFR